VPPGPAPFDILTGLYAAEDFAFDDSGHLISHYVNALSLQEYPPGTVTQMAPTAGGPGGPASLRMLHSGDVAYANVDTGTLYRVSPTGASTPLNSALGYPTGIDIHSSGVIYLADLVGLLRIDPNSGATETIVASGVFVSPNGLTFSADYSQLYVGTREGIKALPMDVDGYPTGQAVHFADSPQGGELLGMAVDACDNVYALWEGDALLRWPASGGAPETLMEVPAGAWMTNMQWGSGVGGWGADRLFITDRQTLAPAYYEVHLGVADKPR
jgi:hypothetical protein